MNAPKLLAIVTTSLSLFTAANAQLVLSGLEYTQDFNTIGSGMPSNWTVTSSATLTTLGDAATFTTAATPWNSTSNAFRNIASDNGTTGDSTSTQASNTNRALGWRPLSGDSGAIREGAITLEIANTSGYENFNLSVSLFTANSVANDQTYALEYRVGSSGSFTSIGTYTTGTPFNESTLSANSITLSALNNQSSPVYIRVRGTTTTGTGNLDTLGIDNVSLTYSAVPEPSTYALIFGGIVLVSVAVMRRRQRKTA